MPWNECSRCRGTSVHDAVESAFTMSRVPHLILPRQIGAATGSRLTATRPRRPVSAASVFGRTIRPRRPVCWFGELRSATRATSRLRPGAGTVPSGRTGCRCPADRGTEGRGHCVPALDLPGEVSQFLGGSRDGDQGARGRGTGIQEDR